MSITIPEIKEVLEEYGLEMDSLPKKMKDREIYRISVSGNLPISDINIFYKQGKLLNYFFSQPISEKKIDESDFYEGVVETIDLGDIYEIMPALFEVSKDLEKSGAIDRLFERGNEYSDSILYFKRKFCDPKDLRNAIEILSDVADAIKITYHEELGILNEKLRRVHTELQKKRI